MGRRQGGLSLRVKMDEWVMGLVVGWGGCEFVGLVSNTLSLPMSAINPSLNGQSQSSVFQSCVINEHSSVGVHGHCVGTPQVP